MDLNDYEMYKNLAPVPRQVGKSSTSYPDLPVQVPENKFRFAVEVMGETLKAYLLNFEGVEHWIPKGHATVGWSDGITANDPPILCADLTHWIVDNKNLL